MDDAATMETTTTTGTTATVASGGKKQERKSAWPMISGEWVEWMMQREGGREGGRDWGGGEGGCVLLEEGVCAGFGGAEVETAE